MCVDDGESRRKLDGEVCVEPDRVKVYEWNVQSGCVFLNQGEIGGLNGRSNEDECVGSEDLVLCEEGFERLMGMSARCCVANDACYPLTHLFDSSAFGIWIQLFEQSHSLLGAELAQALILQEEVHSQIGLCHDCRIENGELPDAREDEVLQCFNSSHTRAIVDQEDMCLF